WSSAPLSGVVGRSQRRRRLPFAFWCEGFISFPSTGPVRASPSGGKFAVVSGQ
ncbi:unnamed protein product, partial [Amoebophrya sp. A120]